MTLIDPSRPASTLDAGRPALRARSTRAARASDTSTTRRTERARCPTSSCASSGRKPTVRITRTRCPSSPSRRNPRLPRTIRSTAHFPRSHRHRQRRSPRRHPHRRRERLMRRVPSTSINSSASAFFSPRPSCCALRSDTPKHFGAKHQTCPHMAFHGPPDSIWQMGAAELDATMRSPVVGDSPE
jgi:hypothetical protein